jgi:hexulose-6-phosphate isomerase
MNRREFVAASAALASAGNLAAARLPIRKAVWSGMLPKGTWEERVRVARAAGFEELELPTMPDMKEAETAKKAAEAAGIRIHSVMNQAHWNFPLSSADPEVVAKSIQGMETSLQNAKLWGAETVLLVPAVVNKDVGYKDAWDRSVKAIRKLLPMAEKMKVIIAVENVWNKFLLSPIEFNNYVDQFKSPYVKAYFDVGNIVLYGFPQDWIRTLGKRIVKLHFKDFSFRRDQTIKKPAADFCALREGDVDWKAVHQALTEIGYKGTATVELPGGDEAYLREVSRRVDLILEGA